jgi:hypothetical protein
MFLVSALVASGHVPTDFNIHEPPDGAWIEQTDSGWQIGATTRSYMALFLIPFMCVWSGGSIGGIYGTQIVKGEFNLGMSLFGIPFILGTVFFGSMALMTVCGKVVVVTTNDEGHVFTGIGSIGWTRSFSWSSITSVVEDLPSYTQARNTNMGMVIALVGQTRLKFGTMLSDARRHYLLQCLRKFLAERPK